jgi:uncharacterized protein YjiS (DUF1127 family)
MSHITDALFFLPAPRKTRKTGFLRTLSLWHRRSASRGDLARLDAHGLRDIGLTRFEAECECAKPFWQA